MSERRSDEDTAIAVEYAFFLLETRGLGSALEYLTARSVPHAAVHRVSNEPHMKRTSQRRQMPRDE